MAGSTPTKKPLRAACRIAIWLIFGLLVTGCGQRLIYPVRGQIVDKAGNPIPGIADSVVEFDSLDHQASANAVVDEQGNFRLSTLAIGDGGHVGKHRVAILRPDRGADVRVPHVIDPKYEKFETSNLTVTVEPRDNVIKLEVDLFRR